MFRNIYTLMFCGITLLACHSHSHQEDEHEEEPLLISVYSDDYEVFAEAEPFETGKKSRVLAHFTTLNNFKPLDSAEVTMILMVNGIEIKQTASKALRSGIYEFFFEPKHSGKGNLVAEVLKNGVLVSIPLGDISCCGGHDGVHHHEEKGGVTDGIVFTKEQSWKIDFATQVPTPKKFGAIFKSAAKVSASNTDFSYVCARTSGFVRFVDDEFMAGRVVESQRDVLHISGNGLGAESANVKWISAKANYDVALADYDREKRLAEKNIVSEKRLQEAKALADKAASEWANVNQVMNAQGEVVKCGAGVVQQLFIKNGEFVNAGDRLFSVSKNKRIVLSAFIPLSACDASLVIKQAVVHLVNGRVVTLSNSASTSITVAKQVLNGSNLVPVFIELDADNDFINGSLVDVYLETQGASLALTVPNTAIVEEQGRFYVFQQVNPELFQKVEVVIGVTNGVETEVVSGLDSHQRVVSRGATIVKLASVSNTVDPHAGHVH